MTRQELAVRVGSGLAAAVGVGVLLLAAWLDPDPTGHGTHQQLGLGACTFLWLTTLPCPLCGATTAWALMADLRPLDAIQTQPFATLLFGIHVALTGVALAEAAKPAGRWDRLVTLLDRWDVRGSAIFLFLMMAGWAYKITQMW